MGCRGIGRDSPGCCEVTTAAELPSSLDGLTSVLLSEKAVTEATRSVEDFCGRLCQQSLAAELVSKLEEMCTCIHEREYAQASKLYMDVAIGAKRWMSDMPVFVHFSMQRQDTEVSWT